MTIPLSPDTCIECERTLNINSWCQCQNERNVRNFNKWTSNNKKMDNLIQLTQRCAQKSMNYLEWIPFDDLDCIEYKSRGSFSTIYSAIWMDGPRNRWDKDDWIRNGPTECALKRIENSQSLSTEYLDNVLKHHQYLYGEFMADFFGVSRDPKGCFIFVMKLYDKNLYKYVDNMKNFRWENVIFILRSVIYGLKRIHNNGQYHGNLHGGNLLISANNAAITDVGLYGPADRTNSGVYGVLPYVAPEVLRGSKYIQASDIYSFGLIMWTLSECERPFCKDPHDLELATRICNGLRPKLITNTPDVYLSLMKRCWHQNPKERPNVVELCEILDSWATTIQHNPTSMISRQFQDANRENSIFESRTIDPRAIYKSQLLNFQPLHITQ